MSSIEFDRNRRSRVGQTFGTPQFSVGVPGTLSAATGVGGALGATGVPNAAAGSTPANPFQDYLNQNPFWQQLNADLAAQGVADEAQARAMAQQAFIRFGEVPTDVSGEAAGWIDQTTRDLAQQNTTAGLSRTAQLAKANKDATRAMRNMLAARGLLRSGELGHQARELQGQYEQAQYTERNALMDTLAGITAGLAAARRQAAMQRAGAAGQLAPGYSPGGGGAGGGGSGGTSGGGGGATNPVAAPPADWPGGVGQPYPGVEEPEWSRRLREGREQRLFY